MSMKSKEFSEHGVPVLNVGCVQWGYFDESKLNHLPPDKAGNMDYINSENRRVIAEHKMTGHFGTWPVPESMLAIRSEVDLLVDHIQHGTDYKDTGTVKSYLTERAGVPVTLARYDPNKGNQYLMLIQGITY